MTKKDIERAPFKPIRRDGKSYRDVVVNLLKDQPFDSIVTYSQIGDALGISAKTNLKTIQRTVLRANHVLLEKWKRGIENEKNVGYRIAHPREHALIATGLTSKAERALNYSLMYYKGADLRHMTETERSLHTGQQMLAEATYGAFQHLDSRLKRIESIIDAKVVNENPL
jgi:hypothetical protein